MVNQQTDRTERPTDRDTDRQHRQTGRTGRETDRQTEQTDTHKDRQRDRHRLTQSDTDRPAKLFRSLFERKTDLLDSQA